MTVWKLEHKDYWGNGYIPEAVRALQRHAFEDLGYLALLKKNGKSVVNVKV